MAQKEAGNYTKGHVKFDGLDLSIENPVGSTRNGTDPNGQPWAVTMTAHYGYHKRTKGADGDQVDVYLAHDPKPGSPVYVFDQYHQDGKFDEHKAVAGVPTQAEAEAIYDAHFSDGSGPSRRRGITAMTPAEFKTWATSDAAARGPVQEQPKAAGEAQNRKPDENQQVKPAPTPPGREVSRETGKYKEGFSEYRANQVRDDLARHNPDVTYTVEEDDSLKNGYVVVGRAPAPAGTKTEKSVSPSVPPASVAPKTASKVEQNATAVPNASAKIIDFGEKIGGAKKDLWTGSFAAETTCAPIAVAGCCACPCGVVCWA